MPIVIQCPTCNRQLRVPDDLLGQPVRCPSCKAMFTASAGGGSAPTAGASQEAERPRRSRPAEPVRPAEEEEGRPVRRRPGPPKDDDDFDDQPADDADEGGRDYEPPERIRLRRRRSAARNAVVAPAISLMVLAGVAMAFYVFTGLLYATGVTAVPVWMQNRRHKNEAERMGEFIGAALAFFFLVAWWAVILFGAFKMRKLQGYGFAMASSIMAMLPCGYVCCILGIPFGIWSLIVLNRPDVKDAF